MTGAVTGASERCSQSEHLILGLWQMPGTHSLVQAGE